MRVCEWILNSVGRVSATATSVKRREEDSVEDFAEGSIEDSAEGSIEDFAEGSIEASAEGSIEDSNEDSTEVQRGSPIPMLNVAEGSAVTCEWGGLVQRRINKLS